MSLEISVPNVIAHRLRLRAEVEHVSVEDLVQRILLQGLDSPLALGQWDTINPRRVQLIEKRFSSGLSVDEERQLKQLQELADQQLEKLDERLIDDLARMERAAADALKE